VPELPDVDTYVHALENHVGGRALVRVRLKSPFLLRSVAPPPSDLEGRSVRGVERIGKRIVLAFDDDLFAVFHLMIAGRFRWRPADAKLSSRIALAAFDFAHGTLLLTEAGTKKRASLHVVAGRDGLAAHDRGGLEVLACDLAAFRERMGAAEHTLKRALCDPRILSGIGNAYSDEILHRARLSPFARANRLDDASLERLFHATRSVLTEWSEHLRAECGDGFPEKVTAFREGMAVHGRFGEPCPDCGAPVQRIVYASNETNYCAGCQTDGRILADRALSRLLKDDWPRSLDELS